jgi:hypothetical protein
MATRIQKAHFAVLAVLIAGCDRLPAIPQKPSISYVGATLVQSPSRSMMEAYFCPQVLGFPASYGCAIFGAAPAEADIKVAFELGFNVDNPNSFPIPVAEMLTAVTVFPQQTRQQLGAICISFCAPDSPSCTGQPAPGACTASSTDIRSVSDFSSAAQGFVLSAGARLGSGEIPSFTKPSVSSAATIPLSTVYAFGVTPFIELVKQLAQQSATQLAAGEDVTFDIPYQLEGTIWFDVGSLGKVAIAYGPVSGTFTIPTEKIAASFSLP